MTFDLHLSGGHAVTFHALPAQSSRAIHAGERYTLLWVRSTRGAHAPLIPRLRRNRIMIGDTCQVQVWAADGDYEMELPPVERIGHITAPPQVTSCPDDSLQWVSLHTTREQSFRIECIDGTIVDIDACPHGDTWATITHPATQDRPAKEEPRLRLLWVATHVLHLPGGLPQTLEVGAPSDLYLACESHISHVRLAPIAHLIRVDHDLEPGRDAS